MRYEQVMVGNGGSKAALYTKAFNSIYIPYAKAKGFPIQVITAAARTSTMVLDDAKSIFGCAKDASMVIGPIPHSLQVCTQREGDFFFLAPQI
ncbi:MAG: hypothetical protein M1519_07465 [Actinobacteria bacterium]|jgi:protein subunit release factor B|nr:hypothetical protein [Actinomycetota bacterium]